MSGRGFPSINRGWKICQITRILTIQKISDIKVTNFTLRADCATLRDHGIWERVSKRRAAVFNQPVNSTIL